LSTAFNSVVETDWPAIGAVAFEQSKELAQKLRTELAPKIQDGIATVGEKGQELVKAVEDLSKEKPAEQSTSKSTAVDVSRTKDDEPRGSLRDENYLGGNAEAVKARRAVERNGEKRLV